VDKSTARQVVLISMLVSGGVITYDLISHKQQLGAGQAFKAVWSMGLLFLLLSMLSDTVPDLAAPFAGVTTLAIVIGRQGALGKIVNIGTTAAPAPAATQKLTDLPTNVNTRPQQPGTNP
jgi:hypothetical protein